MPDSSQDSSVSFDSSPIGSLVGISVEIGQASTVSVPGGAVLGSGDGARVAALKDCVSVDSGSVSVTLLGATPPFSDSDRGKKGSLSVSWTGGSLSGEAILESFSIDLKVGELVQSSASFVLTGA